MRAVLGAVHVCRTRWEGRKIPDLERVCMGWEPRMPTFEDDVAKGAGGVEFAGGGGGAGGSSVSITRKTEVDIELENGSVRQGLHNTLV